MLKIILVAAVASGVLMVPLLAAAESKPVVLKGLDPVALVKGKEVAGSKSIFIDYKKFRYLFTSDADKSTFSHDPDRYAVQRNGECVMMAGMPGDPNLYLVNNGKLYLAGSDSCLAQMKKQVTVHTKDLENRKKVAIMIFPGVQIIDYTGPFEVLGEAGYDVYTVAEKAEPITTNMGMVVTPKYTFNNCPQPDVLVLPGGSVPQEADPNNPQVMFVKRIAPKTTFTMSVCNGAFWLANSGLIDGKKATTFYGMLNDLKTKYPKIDVIDDAKFADNGQYMCTAGLSSGIEGALHMIEKIDGLGEAKSVALNMEYNWQPNAGFARGAFADKYIRDIIGRTGFTLPDGTNSVVLDVSGDKDHWDKSWSLTGKSLSQHDVAQGIVKQLSAKWTAVNTESDGEETTAWKFTGESGTNWTAKTIVKPDPTDASKLVFSIHLEKAAS